MKKFNKGVKLACGVVSASFLALALAGCGKEDPKTSTSGPVTNKTVTPEIPGYHLLFADEFEGDKLNEEIWNRELRDPGWTNNELQAYVADEANGYLKDGELVLKGIENSDGSYTSCKLNTRGKKDFKYGKISVNAKVPKGKGLWPAIWMMPTDESVYGQWPKCGEIDIMEVLGDDTNKAYGTLHWGEPHSEIQGTQTGDFGDKYHTYSVEWEPGEIRWYIDNVEYLVANDWFTATSDGDEKPYPAPFNQNFCLQLNLAIGGDWPGNPEPKASYMKDAEFKIDYVRVYQKDSYNENVTKPQKFYREPDDTGNYIQNGTFLEAEALDDMDGWGFLQNAEGKGSCEFKDGAAIIKTTAKGTQDYSIQFLHYYMPLFKGKTYKITFDAWADENRTINEICMDAPNAGWVRYWKAYDVELTTEKKSFEYTFDMTSKDDNSARLEFNLGNNASTATVYISNVRVEEVK